MQLNLAIKKNWGNIILGFQQILLVKTILRQSTISTLSTLPTMFTISTTMSSMGDKHPVCKWLNKMLLTDSDSVVHLRLSHNNAESVY